VQFLFGTTWTLYVLYLPQLAERAALGRFGGWMLGLTVASGAAFLLLPFAGANAAVLGAAIAVWAVTSSALRSPPWALLSRYAPTPSVPWVSTLVLLGTAIASALAPYLGLTLRGIDPRIPFALSTLTLVAVVAGLMLAERRLPPNPPSEPKPPPPLRTRYFFAALLLLALGFQIHFALSSAARYTQFAPREQLVYLMPVFWIGFSLAMFPASRLVERRGAAHAMVLAAACGGLAMLGAAFAPWLWVLIATQFLSGAGWGAASVAAYSAAVAFGRGGREGRFLGTLFAVLALAVALRLALAGSGATQTHAFSMLQSWLPETLWLSAALLLLAGRRA
jgi:hypothetical protein